MTTIIKKGAKHESAKRNEIDSRLKADIISQFELAGCIVQCMPCKNHHLKIKGKMRVVDFYPTTGTVNCAKTQKYKPYNHRGMSLSRAIERVIALANYGY